MLQDDRFFLAVAASRSMAITSPDCLFSVSLYPGYGEGKLSH
jgi:hypothetical protein